MVEASVGEWVPLTQSRRLPTVSGIYVIRHRETGREYVGQSKNVRERIASHRAARSWHYFGRALRKHGLAAFDVCLLLVGAPSGLGRLEQDAIEARGSRSPAGYNLAAGGIGPTGVTWSEERRRQQSEQRRGGRHTQEAVEKMRQARLEHNGFKGKKHTPETLAKMGAAAVALHTGRKRSDEVKANISASLKGRKAPYLSPEVRARIAEANRKPNPRKAKPGELNGNAKRVGLWSVDALIPIEFGTATEAAGWAGVSLNLMSQWCYGRISPFGVWAYI